VNSSLSRIEKTMSDDLKKTDATTNLVGFCLKNSLPEPIFQTNDSGWVLAKVGKFEFLAKKSKHVPTVTKDAAAVGLLNKLQKLESEEKLKN